MRMHRMGALLGALLTVFLTVTACSSGNVGKTPDRPAPWTTPNGPGGYGGRLLGARWQVDWVTVGGRRTSGPPHGRAWVDFGDDNTALGDYGCTPFKASSEVTATTVTVGGDTTRGTPDGACPAEYRAFEKQLRKTLTGSLAIAEPGEDMTLTNRRGDSVGLRLLWPQGLFEARWQLQALIITDGDVPMTAERQVVFYVFHRDGTVTGNAGCNDFTGRAVFADKSVTLYTLTRTTHRACPPKTLADENYILGQKPRTFSTVMVGRFSKLFEIGDNSNPVAYFGYRFTRITAHNLPEQNN
ncbi:META domain-containing protein [Streptomyces sp. Li-HN-5-11]|uniref:META domain-containing protein n=1 Tax=Streptomyces sp. Li-HN-5-11 TaxID=3075432 RepID=UPI0028AB28AB|nr:META domain-containing protein [Streptomyces sp. Li-HN-5-11]WNM31394.1 META domain-containing protein [Streptomyces sp. Li-HN-5-11]